MTVTNTTAVVYWARGDIADALETVEAFWDSYDEHLAGLPHELVILLTGWRGKPGMTHVLERAWKSGARPVELPERLYPHELLGEALARLPYDRLCLFMPGDRILAANWLGLLAKGLDEENVDAVGATASWHICRPPLRDVLYLVLSGEWGIKTACRELAVTRLTFPSVERASLKLSGLCLRREVLQAFLEKHPAPRNHLDQCKMQCGRLQLGRFLAERGRHSRIATRGGVLFRLSDAWPDAAFEFPGQNERIVHGAACPVLDGSGPSHAIHLWRNMRNGMYDINIRALIKPYLKAKIKQKFPRLARVLKAMRSCDPIDHTSELQQERLKNSGYFPVTVSPERLDFVYKYPRATKDGVPDRQLPINLLNPPFLAPLWVTTEEECKAAPSVNVVLPSSSIKATSGGPNTIYTLVAELLRNHIPVRLLSMTAPPDEDSSHIKQHIARIGRLEHGEEDTLVVLNACTNTSPLALGASDVFIATAWWTAQAIREVLPQFTVRQFVYIIQDFEPNLHAPSSNYVLALETYSMDILPIFNTSLLRDHFLGEGVGIFKNWASSTPPLCFEPAVDRKAFFPERNANGGKKRLLFYARPDAPRNLLELGVAALMRCIEQGSCNPDEWCFHSVSSGTGVGCRPVLLQSPATVLEFLPLPTYEVWAQEMRKTDIVLSLIWSPHPSYPPVEGAACGAWVVTNTCGVKSHERLNAISPQILSGPPTVDGIADALRQAFAFVSEGRKPDARLSYPPTWREAWEPVLPALLDYLGEKGVLPVTHQKN